VEPWRRRELQHEARIRWRQTFAQDVMLYLFLTTIAVIVGWGMWRLDDRSERLFALVAQERAAAAACP
jgi:nicotinamide riboside transporter PnuC